MRLHAVQPAVHRKEILDHPTLSAIEVIRMPAGSNPSYLDAEQYDALLHAFPQVAPRSARPAALRERARQCLAPEVDAVVAAQARTSLRSRRSQWRCHGFASRPCAARTWTTTTSIDPGRETLGWNP